MTKFPVDFRLSGHSHGGQIRVPILGSAVSSAVGEKISSRTSTDWPAHALHQRRCWHDSYSHAVRLPSRGDINHAAKSARGSDYLKGNIDYSCLGPASSGFLRYRRMQTMDELELDGASSGQFSAFRTLWGVSTAAHQVEGNNCNQWSDWEQAGRIKSGDSCGQACDWWENAERDFDIARDLGMKALRLSLEWSRIEPEENRFDAKAYATLSRDAGGFTSAGHRADCLFTSFHPSVLVRAARGIFAVRCTGVV